MSVKLFLGSDIFKAALQGEACLAETLKAQYDEIERGANGRGAPTRRQTVHGQDFHQQFQQESQRQSQHHHSNQQLLRLHGESHLLFAPITDITDPSVQASHNNDEESILAPSYEYSDGLVEEEDGDAGNSQMHFDDPLPSPSPINTGSTHSAAAELMQAESQKYLGLPTIHEYDHGAGSGNGTAGNVDQDGVRKSKPPVEQFQKLSIHPPTAATASANITRPPASTAATSPTFSTAAAARRSSSSVVDDIFRTQRIFPGRRDKGQTGTGPASDNAAGSGATNSSAQVGAKPSGPGTAAERATDSVGGASHIAPSTEPHADGVTPLRFNEQTWRSIVNARDSIGLRRTALHHASVSGNLEIAKMLINMGADLNSIDDGGNTPLHCAARDGRTAMASLLLICGALPNAKDRHGQTALHRAALNGDVDTAAVLIIGHGAAGAAVDVKDREGKTPLMLAAASGKADMISLLATHHADLNLQDDIGFTALHWAALKGFAPVCSLLVGLGANVALRDFTDRDVYAVAASSHVVSAIREAL